MQIIDAENVKASEGEMKEEMSQVLVRLAEKTEELAMKERESTRTMNGSLIAEASAKLR